MRKRIVNWIKKEVKQAGAKGALLGISGGIDSAVVTALLKEAIGRRRVLGLFLSIHSRARDLEDARLLARKLGIKIKFIDLSAAYDNLIRILPRSAGLAKANLKPRLRMSVLYYLANAMDYIVCGTGNKSELMVGYFTKHGDGATDILPIGDLLKKEVKKLAKELGVPQRIIAKPPTAGLWPGQTDEAEMGITYDELDCILERLEKKRKQRLFGAKIDKVRAMIKKSEHKRQGPRICYI